ncbi:kinase-like domain-containing protein [Podospora didyma]|uniref:EKC/KEOPS complex subunit BUD32 n=1 Tax=Podospora didyma TaxID=330526 RepID=A0AAE0N762_9PEZI|nr:kinase-like domain-containing protein [Podospora didyma]
MATQPPAPLPGLASHQKLDEECYENYDEKRFYPVKLGEIFKQRFLVVAKLGHGTVSTAWLCRDLQANFNYPRYFALKVSTSGHDYTHHDEVFISQHLTSLAGQPHPGRPLLRLVLDHWWIRGPYGAVHRCLLFEPLGMTIRQFRNTQPGRLFSMPLLQQSMGMIVLAVDALHRSGVVHTDISPSNILLGVDGHAVFARLEQDEIEHPSAGKILQDRTIYLSRKMPVTRGPWILTDFSAALRGRRFRGDCMPRRYRAPEVIMGMSWNTKVDIWSLVPFMWDLFEHRPLLTGKKEDGTLDDEALVAEMVSVMGPPPKAFLERSATCAKYWDANDNWIAAAPILSQPLESYVTWLHGRDKELLLQFTRRILRWLPEERPTAAELLGDEFFHTTSAMTLETHC